MYYILQVLSVIHFIPQDNNKIEYTITKYLRVVMYKAIKRVYEGDFNATSVAVDSPIQLRGSRLTCTLIGCQLRWVETKL